VSAVWTRSYERQRQGSPSQDSTPALVAAALASGVIAAMAPMSADEAVTVFGDVLAALSRAVEAERTDT
jgi:uncharacterized protein (DUF2062 family)